ncbi:arginine deiminase family protein [Mangrovivirga sp. M17]|uniref:arginine deiminase n=1 Tax=Mangrovivirga halotolerans TaxID=2993936 RepID=A0ABT3RSP7_9BACT|nr:arginine deiminase family protein [Mangrovivirga halotolerans]MCX2744603.1 arginine deiminase family protein [Mangrovivirga halotolerans]
MPEDRVALHSEFGTLKSVIMHRPGKEIDRLTPYNKSELLFDDVPFLQQMQKEHDEFTVLIKQAAGAQVYRLHELLIDVLIDDNLLLEAITDALNGSGIEEHSEEFIARYSTSECAGILLHGIKVNELKRKYQHKVLDKFDDYDYLIKPNPNLYFMRDPAAVVQTGVISSKMKFPGRQRESKLLRTIFENHDLFKGRVDFLDTGEGVNTCIEGGDVIVLSDKALAIGHSERTDTKAIEAVARQVLKKGGVERVYEVHLPKVRNCMHLDTVFTIIDENLVVTYPDAMQSVLQTNVYRLDEVDSEGNVSLHKEEINDSILKVLQNEIDHLEVVETGDGNPDYARREQWFDGANVFAIGPRRVISYNRNIHTNRALRHAGVEVLEISSSELSRGLGGPRCMTMPIERQKF